MDSDNLVRVAGVRIVRTASFGVFCTADEREVFVPFAKIYDPPASRLVPGKRLTIAIPVAFARELHLEGGERRQERRHAAQPYDPVWLYCRAIGGQAILRDISAHGIGITVAGRHTWRLIEALREAQTRRTDVELSGIPNDGQRQARVVWAAEGEPHEMRFGLRLTDDSLLNART